MEYFLAVAREGNITRAAEKLHVTQPTISRQLADLEEALGTPLLIRGKRQVTLTDAGALFQQRAEEIIALMDKTRRDLAEQGDLVSGTVTLGCVESCASRLLPQALGAFSQLYPQVQYELYSADGDDIREKLDRGELDFGILLEPIEAAKYDFIRLPYWETWGIVLRRDHPLARKQTIEREDFLSIPLSMPRREIVQDSIAEWFGVERSQLHIFSGHTLLNNVALLVEAGLCCAVCVDGAFDLHGGDSLCFRPFSPERTTGHVLAWKKNRVFHPAASRFRDYIRAHNGAL